MHSQADASRVATIVEGPVALRGVGIGATTVLEAPCVVRQRAAGTASSDGGGGWATRVQQEAVPLLALHSERAEQDFISFAHGGVSDLPCNIRREGGKPLVIGGPSLVILEGKACNPL